MKRIGIVLIVTLAFSSLSWGLILNNANFDTQTIGDGQWSGPGDITDWDINGGWSHAQNLASDAITPEAQSGDNTCGLNGVDGADGGAYISQIVKEDDGTTEVLVQANKIYKVTVWVGRRTGDQGSYAGILKVYLQETSGATPTDIAEATYDLIGQAQDSWTQQTLYLSTGSSPAGIDSPLRLMLRNVGDRTATHWHQQVVLDDVTISPSNVAKNVYPDNESTLIPVGTSLSWEAPDEFIPIGYDVRIGKDPNMTTILATGTTETTIDAEPDGDLDYNTLYYWRVDSIDPNNGGPITYLGNVWTFTTIPDSPIIISQPESQTAAIDSSVEFSVTAENTTNYAWYKSADAVVGDDLPVGMDSPILSLSLVQVTDEAYYYCIATGPNGSATSDMATLGIERQVAHWTLDSLVSGQYADTSGEGHHADPNGVPAFVAGAVDNAVTITPANGWASAGTWDPSEFSGQLTISMWVKSTGDFSNWRGLIAKRNAWGSDTMMWRLESDNGTGWVVFGSASGSIVSDIPLPTNEWEHVAVTFDGTTAMIYRDGVLDASGAVSFNNKTDANLMIGVGEKSDAGVVSYVFDGDLDDIQIYNYALDYIKVADIYLATAGGYVCTESYASEFDFDGNCIVDLNDFAELSAQWLSCGRYPQSECD